MLLDLTPAESRALTALAAVSHPLPVTRRVIQSQVCVRLAQHGLVRGKPGPIVHRRQTTLWEITEEGLAHVRGANP
jgi:hypothetical protein